MLNSRQRFDSMLAIAPGKAQQRFAIIWCPDHPAPQRQRSGLIELSICISSTGAPLTWMKATLTPGLGLFGSMRIW